MAHVGADDEDDEQDRHAGVPPKRDDQQERRLQDYGDPAHLAEAKRLLDSRVEHAPAEYRESMLTNVKLHRDIVKAWNEQASSSPPQ